MGGSPWKEMKMVQDPIPPPIVPKYVPKLQFSQRQQTNKQEKKSQEFLNIFKKLRINIPFIEALEQMPNYAKFKKQIF